VSLKTSWKPPMAKSYNVLVLLSVFRERARELLQMDFRSQGYTIFSGFEHTRLLATNEIDTVRKGLKDFYTVGDAILVGKAKGISKARNIDVPSICPVSPSIIFFNYINYGYTARGPKPGQHQQTPRHDNQYHCYLSICHVVLKTIDEYGRRTYGKLDGLELDKSTPPASTRPCNPSRPYPPSQLPPPPATASSTSSLIFTSPVLSQIWS
jgi:hypothetical protein